MYTHWYMELCAKSGNNYVGDHGERKVLVYLGVLLVGLHNGVLIICIDYLFMPAPLGRLGTLLPNK